MFTHHALLVSDASLETVKAAVSETGPDYELLTYQLDRISIDLVREITRAAWQTAAAGRVFIVEGHSLTPEAQNALLKLLEEPPPQVFFVLLVGDVESLLPTLQSRLQRWSLPESVAAKNDYEQEFLAATVADRLNLIATHTKNKNQAWQQAIKNALIKLARQSDSPPEMKQAVLTLENYHNYSGASQKMLLEHVTLLL